MYFILTKDCNKAYYLLENKEYTLGRKACDIIIQNDTSISRKHASISVKQGKVQITDLGARYNTFVNNTKLHPNVETALNIGDEIKLGILQTIYILKEQKLITSCSGLPLQEKKGLAKIMKELNGTVLMTWSQECSCLTVNEIMLTLKTLCALIVGQPIVTMNFWTNFVENVKKNLPPPDHSNYKAVYAESILNRNIESANQQSRKSLFQNKVLVFKTKLAIAKIEAAVELAGGTCVHFNEKKITKETFSLSNPEYLLIQDDEKDFNQNDSFMNMVKYIQSIGKRSIPFQEIAMAIVTGSCEKNCNPNFNRIAALLKNEEMVFTNDILATETQTQTETFLEKPSIIVPDTDLEVKPLESIDMILNNTNELNVMQSGRTQEHTSVASVIDNFPSTSKELRKNKNYDPSSGKREAQEIGNDNKRIRLENTKVGTCSSSDTSNLPPRNTVATSTQHTSQDDEEMDIKLESIDEMLNDTIELDLHKAKMSKRESLTNSNKVNDLTSVGQKSKICNDPNSGKREGQDICNDNSKRIRLENTEIGTYSSVFGNKTSNLLARNNIVTSTEDASHDDEVDMKLESVDKMPSKGQATKNSNEHNSLKRVGEELNKGVKRTRAENSNTSEEATVSPLLSTAVNVSAVIDLTQDTDRIVTSTQVERNNVQRSFEADSKKLIPENPFGFIRCGSKSKPKNTAHVSDFFKPVARNTTNESIANISRISAETTLVSGKKKSPEKSNIKQNPFALNKPQASNIFALNKSEAGTSNQSSFKTNPSTSSDSKNDKEKINPFGDFRKKNDKSKKNSSNESTERCEFVPYIFDISVVDSDMEKKYNWLSKDTISADEPDCTSKNAIYSDEKLQKFFESFRNCVVVETLPEPVERISQNKSREETLSGKTNYKKFRKVQPLHMQTTIIPRSLYSTS